MVKQGCKVLIISSEFPPGPGGIGQHAYSLAQALYKEGAEILVLTQGDYAWPEEVACFDSNQPFAIKRYPRFGRLLTYLNRLLLTLSVIYRQGFQKIILTGKFSLWQGLMIKVVFPKVRTLAVLHGTEVQLPNLITRRLTQLAIKKSDIIVPVSAFTRSLLPEDILLEHKCIRIIPNGTTNWEEKPDHKDSNKSLPGTPSLLTVGHVSPRKGQHRIIRALPLLKVSFPGIHYHIVGLPIQQAALESLARQLDVEKHITFHGRVPEHRDLAFFYQEADVLMLLSENQPDGDVEGFGIVALEANYFGKPVIGAKYCGIEDAVKPGISGYLVDGDDPEEILEALRNCLAHQQELDTTAREWASRFSWDTLGKEFFALLN